MTRKSKPRRACPMCKAHKYAGNGKDRDKPSVRRAKEGKKTDGES